MNTYKVSTFVEGKEFRVRYRKAEYYKTPIIVQESRGGEVDHVHLV